MLPPKSSRIVAANLHRKPVRIEDVESEIASLLVDRRNSPRFEIRSDGVLIETVDSYGKMIHLAGRIPRPQDEEVLPKYELVVPVSFVHGTTEGALVEIGGTLQIADVQRDVIDAVALESGRGRRASAAR